MLEAERYDRGSDNDDGPASAGHSADVAADPAEAGLDRGAEDPGGTDSGGHGSRTPGRGHRAATRPAGPPADPGGQPAQVGSEESEPAAETPPRVPAPGLPPAADPAAASGQSAATDPAASAGQPAQVLQAPQAEQPSQVPQAAFQPPLVIFQPPDIAPAGTRKAGGGSAPAAESGAGEARPPGAGEQDDGGPAGKRRRRGGRGHAKGRGTANGGADGTAERPTAGEGSEQGAEAPADGADEAARSGRQAAETETGGTPGSATADGSSAENGGDEAAGGQESPARRRRRRRRSGSGHSADAEPPAADDPPNTVVHVRAPRNAAPDEAPDVKGVKGSTRLEAKRQRRREGRESGRRRQPVITESEFLARREAVKRIMVVRQRGDRTQIAVLEDGILVEHYVDKASHQSYVGNVYLGRVQNVLPSMEAAFVDIGKGRNAVLYAGEVNFDASGLEGESKRIESALKSGQSILVQATKDPIGHKGARLTSQVSLPGRYLVYVPGASMTGISRKLPATERTRLKQILRKVIPENAGVIVRTAAEGTGEEELSRDVARLAAQWENIERKAASATPPELLYSEPDLTIRVVRDIFNEDFSELVVAGDDGWDTVNEYVRYVAPHLAGRLRQWQDDADVFASYRIDEQLAKALERKVWLPSGGSLVIDRTEAMTVIDVNTGKFTGQGGNLEETVTRNNLEAAEEIVRELRLRDIGGIIVVDFIDMVLESNRELVLRRLLECLARDRTKHQVAEVTSLGLVQMTRKRVGSGLLEAFSEPCECCNGRGVHVSMDLLDAPSGKRTQIGRGGGRGEVKGQGDGRGQGDDKGPSGSRWQPAKAQDDSRGQGKAGGQMRTSGDENGGSRGAGSVATGAGDSDVAHGGGEAIAEGPRRTAAQEEKPSGRRRRRKQAAPDGDGGHTVAPAAGAGTFADGGVPASTDAVTTPVSEAVAAGHSGSEHAGSEQMGTARTASEQIGSDHTGTHRPGTGFTGSEQVATGFTGSEHLRTRHLDSAHTGAGHTDVAVAATGPDDDVTAADATATADAGGTPPPAPAAAVAPAAPPAGSAQAGSAPAAPPAGSAQAGSAPGGPPPADSTPADSTPGGPLRPDPAG